MSWTTTRLKHLCLDAGQYGLNVSAQNYAPSGHRLIRTSDIDEAGALRSRDNAVFVEDPRDLRFALRDGDVVISRSGTLGRAMLLRSLDAPSTFAGYLVRFRPRASTEPRFLMYLTASKGFRAAIEADATTSTIQNFNAERYANIPVMAPPLDEQRRIADFLDVEARRIETIEEVRRRQLGLLVERRFAQVREILRSGLDGENLGATVANWLPVCPAHWSWKKVCHVTRCLDGKRVPLSSIERSTRRGPFPYYGASAVVDYVDDYIFDERLVLLGEDGAQLGNPNYEISTDVSGKIWVNNHAHVLRPLGIEPRLLAAIFNVFDRELCMSGSTREKITQDAMSALWIPVPPRDEQVELVQQLEDRRAGQERAELALKDQLALLAERRQALITAAITGQIDVTTARGVSV